MSNQVSNLLPLYIKPCRCWKKSCRSDSCGNHMGGEDYHTLLGKKHASAVWECCFLRSVHGPQGWNSHQPLQTPFSSGARRERTLVIKMLGSVWKTQCLEFYTHSFNTMVEGAVCLRDCLSLRLRYSIRRQCKILLRK